MKLYSPDLAAARARRDGWLRTYLPGSLEPPASVMAAPEPWRAEALREFYGDHFDPPDSMPHFAGDDFRDHLSAALPVAKFAPPDPPAPKPAAVGRVTSGPLPPPTPGAVHFAAVAYAGGLVTGCAQLPPDLSAVFDLGTLRRKDMVLVLLGHSFHNVAGAAERVEVDRGELVIGAELFPEAFPAAAEIIRAHVRGKRWELSMGVRYDEGSKLEYSHRDWLEVNGRAVPPGTPVIRWGVLDEVSFVDVSAAAGSVVVF